MAIPASELVRIMPRVLAGTGQDLVFNGLFLTDNAAAPADGELLQVPGRSERRRLLRTHQHEVQSGPGVPFNRIQ